eukprot:280337-Pyramimonas_sp.AAC.1
MAGAAQGLVEGANPADPLCRGAPGPPGPGLHPSLETDWERLTSQTVHALTALFSSRLDNQTGASIIGTENRGQGGPWHDLLAWLIWATSADVLRARARALWGSRGFNPAAVDALEALWNTACLP